VRYPHQLPVPAFRRDQQIIVNPLARVRAIPPWKRSTGKPLKLFTFSKIWRHRIEQNGATLRMDSRSNCTLKNRFAPAGGFCAACCHWLVSTAGD